MELFNPKLKKVLICQERTLKSPKETKNLLPRNFFLLRFCNLCSSKAKEIFL